MSLIRRIAPQLRSLSQVIQRPQHADALAALQKRNLCRTISRFDNYEGDGKTTVNMLDKELAKYMIVDSYNKDGFHLSNESFAYGPIILFPNLVFQWKVKTIDDINSDSLTLFKLLEPKLDLVLIGIGDFGYWSAKSLAQLKKEMKSSGLNVELMATRDAVATYNFMLSDFRVVAGAFLPPMSKENEKLLRLKKD